MKNNALNGLAGVRLGLVGMLRLLVGALTASNNWRRLWNSHPPPPNLHFLLLKTFAPSGRGGQGRITTTNRLIHISNYCFIQMSPILIV